MNRLLAGKPYRKGRRMEQQKIKEDEFEHFAYIITHDLKSPLRAIQILTEWIIRGDSERLSESGRENLALLQDRVRRMDDIIDSVSAYARIGHERIEPESVDLNHLVDYRITVVNAPDHIQCIRKDTLPVLVCKRMHMDQVFRHLIENAVMYMDKPQGRVEIGCREDGDFWRFSVSDNGPGIDPKYHERIFHIFQTLHAKDDIETKGVGLTLSKRIVEVSGGRIWLESKPNAGCTFYFTFPRAKP